MGISHPGYSYTASLSKWSHPDVIPIPDLKAASVSEPYRASLTHGQLVYT